MMKKIMIIGLAAALLFFLVIEGLILSGFFQKGSAGLDYIIILGAKVNGRTPSESLHYRIERALEYLLENPETIAVLSGGQGFDELISEAECMQQELTDRGISKDRLILEDRSTNTMENLKYSLLLIGDQEARIGIVSNNFHVFRAVKIAKKLGMEQAEGIAAKAVWFRQPQYMLREFLAVCKEILVGNI